MEIPVAAPVTLGRVPGAALSDKYSTHSEQIIGFLREADAGLPIKELCRRHGFSEASYYLWRSKFGGLEVSDAKRLKALEQENARLKKLLAESLLEQEVTREALRKKW
jgi:putative transposase